MDGSIACFEPADATTSPDPQPQPVPSPDWQAIAALAMQQRDQLAVQVNNLLIDLMLARRDLEAARALIAELAPA